MMVKLFSGMNQGMNLHSLVTESNNKTTEDENDQLCQETGSFHEAH
jgi:hypothetical protein